MPTHQHTTVANRQCERIKPENEIYLFSKYLLSNQTIWIRFFRFAWLCSCMNDTRYCCEWKKSTTILSKLVRGKRRNIFALRSIHTLLGVKWRELFFSIVWGWMITSSILSMMFSKNIHSLASERWIFAYQISSWSMPLRQYMINDIQQIIVIV